MGHRGSGDESDRLGTVAGGGHSRDEAGQDDGLRRKVPEEVSAETGPPSCALVTHLGACPGFGLPPPRPVQLTSRFRTFRFVARLTTPLSPPPPKVLIKRALEDAGERDHPAGEEAGGDAHREAGGQGTDGLQAHLKVEQVHLAGREGEFSRINGIPWRSSGTSLSLLFRSRADLACSCPAKTDAAVWKAPPVQVREEEE